MKLGVEQMIERAQKATDDAIAKVNTLQHYLGMIRPEIDLTLPDTKPITERLESIYKWLENLWEE